MKFFKENTVEYHVAQEVAPGVRRVMANNPSLLTYHGTGTFIIGEGKVTIIDPGPCIPSHLDALLNAIEGEQLLQILITHTHLDHSPAAAVLKSHTGAPTMGFGPHVKISGTNSEEGADYDFCPDVVVKNGDIIDGTEDKFEVIHTPGHTSNHLCFSLNDRSILFCGDHVMGWSTTIVSPPDGNMASYRNSLKYLTKRTEEVYLPTHGPSIKNPKIYIQDLIKHRDQREIEILDSISSNMSNTSDIVDKLYINLDPRLHSAAQRSVLAHLIQLVEEGKVLADTDYINNDSNFYTG
tara:strand:- start:50410 stop:51294 length:885 start_codon:yes stop_codon:yes gene_type:complete